ncbi:MAG: hypothetical protein LBI91_06300 [Spirochaetaceae bacterium]|jgi:hypothetical protein|nr:hypothetical protein [Spirochaetaceae bacterium]
MKTVIGMAKINLKHSKTAYWVAGIGFALASINYILSITIDNSGSETVALGNYFYLIPLCLSVFTPAQNFSKLMNLGGKRMDFFKSSLLAYATAAAAASLASIAISLSIDKWMVLHGKINGVLDILNVYGFMARGPAAAFFQMTAFLLLAACAAHTLTLIQGHWYGWLADAMIAAIISVFTPIAPLRAALAWFFNMIIFHDIAAVQIVSCLALGAAIYCAGLVPIKSKQI